MKKINRIKNILTVLFLGIIINWNTIVSVAAQIDPPDTREEFARQYEENSKKTRINGVYIPVDIDEAYDEFIHLSPEESIQRFASLDEDLVARKLHFGIGRWMIVNWSFYEGSRLSNVLKQKGVPHPDDMADFLIRIFHRKLNSKPLDMDQLIGTYKSKREAELREKGSIFFDKTDQK